jgi:hypothetical protein
VAASTSAAAKKKDDDDVPMGGVEPKEAPVQDAPPPRRELPFMRTAAATGKKAPEPAGAADESETDDEL